MRSACLAYSRCHSQPPAAGCIPNILSFTSFERAALWPIFRPVSGVKLELELRSLQFPMAVSPPFVMVDVALRQPHEQTEHMSKHIFIALDLSLVMTWTPAGAAGLVKLTVTQLIRSAMLIWSRYTPRRSSHPPPIPTAGARGEGRLNNWR